MLAALRCENEEKWRKIWEEERAEIQKAEAEAQAGVNSPCAEMFTFRSCSQTGGFTVLLACGCCVC